MNKPRFTHDCPNVCRYLGQIHMYDLYICDAGNGLGPTVIARYGSEGSHYASTGIDVNEAIAAIRHNTSGLEGDRAIILAIFQLMPSLLLNIWNKQNNESEEPPPPQAPQLGYEDFDRGWEIGWVEGRNHALRSQE